MTPIGTIPEHWDLSEIKKLICLETGKRMKGGADVNGEVISIGGEHISEDGLLNLAKPKYISLDFYNNELRQGKIHANDVLLVKDGATTGKLAFISKMPKDKMAINEHVFIIRGSISELLDNQFLYYALKSSNGQKQIRFRYHGLIGGVTRGDIESIILPIPPIHEQRAISHVLRTIQHAREARLREVALERERKAALMEHLFTHGTRGEATKTTEIGEMPESWGIVELRDACEFLQYGTSKYCNDDNTGIPVLRIPNVIDGRINIQDLKFIKLPLKEIENLNLEPGDLLFVRTNGRKEYLGRCAVFNGEFGKCLFASYLIRVRLNDNILIPKYVNIYLMTNTGRSFLSGRASNSADGKFNINTQTIKRVRLPRPSLEEQQEISCMMSAYDSKIAALENEASLHQELFRAMLEELMSGRLQAGALVESAA
jgi:type I restriction enzyme, S subunit